MRGLAVAAVLAFHGGLSFARGGFLGVDAFFVLSGYLITTLLLREWDSAGRIRLAAFWARRARRLLPALLVVIAAVVIAGRAALPPEEVALLRGDALATLGYVANWRMIDRGGDYFAQTASPSLLQHAWSLGIEEQFYLLWPLLLVGLMVWGRRLRWRRALLLVVCLAGAAASTLAGALLFEADLDPSRAYYGSDTRAMSLLVGCGLAVLLASAAPGASQPGRAHAGPALAGPVHASPAQPGAMSRRSRIALAGAAIVGATGTAWAWTRADGTDAWLYLGGLLAVALAVAVVIADAVLVPRGITARALSIPPLPALGVISYGVYLWHWPVFQVVNNDRTGLLGGALFAVRCAATIALATVSYFALERPIRRGEWAPPRLRPALAAAGVAGTALVVLATTAVTPPSERPSSATPADPSLSAAGAPQGAAGTRPGAARVPQPNSLLTRPGRAPGPPRIVFFGDSVAWSLGAYFPPVPGFQVGNGALQGCGIARVGSVRDAGNVHAPYPKCPRWDEYWAAAVRHHRPDIAVVLLGRWETMDRRQQGTWRHVGQPAFDAYLRRELDRMLQVLTANGARVVLCTTPYSRRHERPDGGLYPEDQTQRIDAWNALLREFATAHPAAVTVVDLGGRVTPGGEFSWSVGGIRMRSDGLHFTRVGVRRWIAPWLTPQLVAASE